MHCRNNGGGHYNHSFFWKVMTNPSNSNGPSSELKSAIDSSFGSLDELKTKFNAAAAARFGEHSFIEIVLIKNHPFSHSFALDCCHGDISQVYQHLLC